MGVELAIAIAALLVGAGIAAIGFFKARGAQQELVDLQARHEGQHAYLQELLDKARADAGLLRHLLREMADEYETELKARHDGLLYHPSFQQDFENDMATVREARAAVCAQPWEMVDLGGGVDGIVRVETRHDDGRPNLWFHSVKASSMARAAKAAAGL